MKRIGWLGWSLAGCLFLQTAAMGLATSFGTNPLEGRLLEHTNGSFYVYHDGVKFTVEPASTGDQVIDAVPTASESQWNSFFAARAPGGPSAPSNPQLLPAYPSS